jgi:chemotaxis protein CheC
LENVTQEDIEILREVASIGMGNASAALEQLLNAKIEISLPEIQLIDHKDVSGFFSDNEILLGVVLKMLGEVKGKMLYLFKKHDANKIVEIVNKANGFNTTNMPEEIEISTIKEMANIMSGSYLNALSQFTHLSILPSLPHIAMDTVTSIFGISSLSDEEDVQLILIRSKLSILGGEFDVMGSLIIELDKNELSKLLKKIKTVYTEGI